MPRSTSPRILYSSLYIDFDIISAPFLVLAPSNTATLAHQCVRYVAVLDMAC